MSICLTRILIVINIISILSVIYLSLDKQKTYLKQAIPNNIDPNSTLDVT